MPTYKMLTGYDLPATLRDVAMQKSRLYYELEALENVIAKYNKNTTSLSRSETHLMKKHLLDMERHILPGLTRVTWTALGIWDYIKDITKGLYQEGITLELDPELLLKFVCVREK